MARFLSHRCHAASSLHLHLTPATRTMYTTAKVCGLVSLAALADGFSLSLGAASLRPPAWDRAGSANKIATRPALALRMQVSCSPDTRYATSSSGGVGFNQVSSSRVVPCFRWRPPVLGTSRTSECALSTPPTRTERPTTADQSEAVRVPNGIGLVFAMVKTTPG